HGIWRVNDMLELVAAVEVYLKHWAPKGKRLVAISNSGAACVQAADAASQRGMTMASLAPKTLEGLAAILPKFATITNPIDITAALLSNPNLFGDILPVIASDPASDGFIIGLPVAGEGYDMASMAEDAAELCRSTGKPLAIAAPQASVAAYFRERGLPVFDTEMQAVNALAQLMAHQALIKDLKLRMPDAQAKAEAWRWQAQACKAELGAEPTQAARCLNEADSLALLKASGVSVVPHALVQTVQQALAWFETIRGDKSDMKFVLKGCSSQIQHKSELGLVRLDLQSAQAIEAAYEDMLRQAAKVSVQLDGVLIAQQVKARREVMIGARYDPVFGTVILAGDGGLYLEAMPDSVVLLAPFDEQAIRAKLRTLRIAPLLDG
ncbi:MAG: CoA-binding protein, partial [Betaproteobacteria bacterium]|nr:CoA-binding protein [Betaproteobacteria bacterium]